MKTIQNKTREPLRVPLPRGKTLHLGPGKAGQVSNKDLDHQRLKDLIKEGKVEVLGEGPSPGVGREQGRSPHEATHGHHPPSSRQVKGDR